MLELAIGFILGIIAMCIFIGGNNNKELLDDLIEEIDILKKQINEYEKEQLTSMELGDRINEVLEYLDNSNMSFVDKNEIAIRLKGSDKE